jgi:S1-C subfamily serine protease
MKIKVYIILFFTLFAADSFAQYIKQVAPGTARRSTVLLLMRDKFDNPLPMGNGFVVDKNHIVTNFHIIENSAAGTAVGNGGNNRYIITGMVAKDEKHDLAILYVEDMEIDPVSFSDSLVLNPGDPVYAISNPKGIEAATDPGIVNGIVNFKGIPGAIKKDSLIQMTANVQQVGNGGPVVDKNGKVIGVAVSTDKKGIAFNFIIPFGYVQKLLDKPPPKTISYAKTKRSKSSLLSSDWSQLLREAVIGISFKFDSNPNTGFYYFSIQNNLNKPVKNIKCLVIFYNSTEFPIETEAVTISRTIMPKLGIRTDVLGRPRRTEVRDLTFWTEIRILGFEIAE